MTKSKDNGAEPPLEIGLVEFCAINPKNSNGKA